MRNRNIRRDSRLLCSLLVATLGLVLFAARATAGLNDVASSTCYTLTIEAEPTAGGTVTATEPNCPNSGDAEKYSAGTEVALTADPADGYGFAGWGGDGDGQDLSTIMTMDEDKAVTATFALSCFALTRSHSGQGADPAADPDKSPDCPTGQYTAGATIQLTAAPANGWGVGGWSGTKNDDSTSITNTAIMPAAAHNISVNYAKFSSFIPIVFHNWPQWEWIGDKVPNLYTFIACPTDPVRRYAGATDKLYEWEGENWSEMSDAPLNVREFLFVGDGTDACDALYAASFNGNVWRLVGQTWEQVGTNDVPTAVTLARRGRTLFVGSLDGIYSYDLDGGEDTAWRPVLPDTVITRLSSAGGRIYASVFGEGARYNDTCNNTACDWTKVGEAPFGDTFDVLGSESPEPPKWAVLATVRGLYRWDGVNWSNDPISPPPNRNTFTLARVGDQLLAGVQNGGVWNSFDKGISWTPMPIDNRQDHNIIDLVHVPGNGIYAVTPNDGIWRWPTR